MLSPRVHTVIAGLALALPGVPVVAQQLEMQLPDMQQLPATVRSLTSQGYEIKAVYNGLLYLQKGKDVFECKLVVYRDGRSGQVRTRSECNPLE